jgi:hypothetical protein
MKQVILVVLLLGNLALPLSAGSRNPSGFIISTVVQDTNRWVIGQDNRGRFVTGGSNGGATWPKGSNHLYIFGAGIWVGVVDSTLADTAVTWGYNPNSGAAEFAPSMPNGDTTGAIMDSLARVYRSDIPADTAQWPERDSLGRMIMASDQELWAITNDVNPIYMQGPDLPIGLQVIRRSYAWNSPGPWGDIVKMEFEVKNITGRFIPPARTLRKMIVGLCIDPDIGNESGSAANDLCYFDRTSGSPFPNMVVQYQLAQEPGWSNPPPYFVGFRTFLETPKATDTVKVLDDQFPHTILPGQPLGLTAVKFYTIQTDPSTPPERYLLLKGMFSFSDTNDAYGGDSIPGDKRFLASCGPFDLPNDSTVRLSMYIIGGNDSSEIRRKAELLAVESPAEPVPQRVSGIELYPVTPNPATSATLLRYALPGPSLVSLKVYDISGRLIRELDRGERSAGVHPVRWDGRNGAGLLVPGGVYFYRLEAGGYTRTRSVVLLR